jgi:predicted O-methyltransferase YrrM
MSLVGRISPDAPVLAAWQRALMLFAASRLRGRSDRGSRSIRHALRRTGTGRYSPDERAWLRRIEDRRRRIFAGESAAAGRGDLASAVPWWSIPPVWGRFLFRLLRELEPRSCLELGAGFGVSGAYQAAALRLNRTGTLVSLDQEESLARIAREGIAELGLGAISSLHMGPIGTILGMAAASSEPIDYAYIDAEHTEAATVSNFEQLLPHLADGAVVVVDDIRLDSEMKRAWDRISRNERARLALGLRRLGVVVVGCSPSS